ncbi:hypothetical protein GCM10027180_28390 [Microbulbifer echini]
MPSQQRFITGSRMVLSGFLAVAVASLVDLPAWVAVLGATAYFARGSSLRAGSYNLACTVTGLGLGFVVQAVIAKWPLELTLLSLPLALLFSAVGAWAMGLVTGISNIASYAIGILIAFAAPLPISLDSYFLLIAASAVGAISAGLADYFWPGRSAISC